MRTKCLLGWLALCLGLQAQPPTAAPPGTTSRLALSEAVNAVTELPEYRSAHWGLLAVDLASGEVLLERNAGKFFAPASVTKLFSTAAALDALGPDQRFHTRLVYRGKLEEAKSLNGDLILVADADFTLGGRTQHDGTIAFADHDHIYANGNNRCRLTPIDPLQGLRQLARAAAEKIKTFDGDVLIDDRLFDRAEGTGSGPGRLTPIMVNDNLIDFLISPGKQGEAAIVEHRPHARHLIVDAVVETGPKDAKPEISITVPAPGRFVVRGRIPAEHAPLLRVREVDDPASHARALLLEALQEAGIKTRVSAISLYAPDRLPPRDQVAKLPLLAEMVSPPFSEHMKLILKVSHNLHASTLPLVLASRQGERSLPQGLRQQGERLKKLNVPLDEISFGGGAGGARADLVTPRATVSLLRNMATRSDFELFRKALPILGVDGTLAGVVDHASPARGKFFAKTGTYTVGNALLGKEMLTSKALAGYGETSKGRKVAFAFFVNYVPIGEGGAVKVGRDLGKLCEILYRGD